MKKIKVVIFGGAGFVGNSIVKLIDKKKYEVVVFDNLSTGFVSNLEDIDEFEFVTGDIRKECDVDNVLNEAEIVYHLAALTSVEESFYKSELYYENNVYGTHNIVRGMLKNKVRKIIYSSSSAVYGEVLANGYDENFLPNPNNIYGLTKLDGEYIIKIYAINEGLEYTILRYQNVYGPKQSFDSDYCSVIPLFINNALNEKVLKIYGDGEQRRDFVYVEDIANANILSMNSGANETFNVATGELLSINYLAEKIKQIVNKKIKIEHYPPRKGDDLGSVVDTSRIKDELKWSPQTTFEQGLLKTYNYYAGKN
ncbi:MAG: NAD-dependent epimerase/dehydratase family protein [Oligoflexia bacterium]|nr:NAD-dependent epimerase/dehydratase family protein [Oligoflexia bacterium]